MGEGENTEIFSKFFYPACLDDIKNMACTAIFDVYALNTNGRHIILFRYNMITK